MGRTHLSAQYGIETRSDMTSTSRRSSPVPKFLDAPFDLDAEVASGPDVVYEAFLSPEELHRREASSAVRIASLWRDTQEENRTVSPVESIETDSTATTTTGTVPSTRVHTPAPSAHPNTMGVRVLQLAGPLSAARDAALPALQSTVSSANVAEIDELALSLVNIIRPHIASAIAPFRDQMPDAECLGHMFERSVIFDLLGTNADRSEVGTHPMQRVVEALDGADERVRSQNAVDAAELPNSPEDLDSEDDDLVSDPGMDEEDMIEENSEGQVGVPARSSTVALSASLNRWWNDQDPARIDWARHLSPSRTPSPAPIIPPRIDVAPTNVPSQGMEVDTDTDTESSSGRSNSTSVYRASSSRAAFHPRIVTRTQRLPIMATGSAYHHLQNDYYEHDRFIPIDRIRAPSPLR